MRGAIKLFDLGCSINYADVPLDDEELSDVRRPTASSLGGPISGEGNRESLFFFFY